MITHLVARGSVTHMLQLSRFEQETPLLSLQLPSSHFFLKFPFLRLFWLKCQRIMNFASWLHFFTNSMWKSSLLVIILGTCVALGYHLLTVILNLRNILMSYVKLVIKNYIPLLYVINTWVIIKVALYLKIL